MNLVVKVKNQTDHRSDATFHFEDGKIFSCFIESSSRLSSLADPWLALSIPLAMAIGVNLKIEGVVSESSLLAAKNVQAELKSGHDNFREISIVASQTVKTGEQLNSDLKYQNATFFSGGLDSTYSALSLEGKPALLSVLGFDIPVNDEAHWKLSLDLIRKFAEDHELSQITIKTNIREMSDNYVDWGRDYFGAALAGIALSVAGEVARVFIPSSFAENYRYWGSFPTLDRSFSTNYMSIEDHGTVVRIAKAAYITDLNAQESIRVCWQNKEGKSNCGKCSKCLRTALEFWLVGAEDLPSGLNPSPSFGDFSKIRISKTDLRVLMEDLDWIKRHQGRFVAKYVFIFRVIRAKTKLRESVVKSIPHGAKRYISEMLRNLK
jgi:hypothetical protein